MKITIIFMAVLIAAIALMLCVMSCDVRDIKKTLSGRSEKRNGNKS